MGTSAAALCCRTIEELEFEHMQRIRYAFLDQYNRILEGLNSRLKIKNDWYTIFKKTRMKKNKNASDLDKGAERVFHYNFAQYLNNPNSSPIGADLMYETFNAFCHIDIKTIVETNWGDYKGKVAVEMNQTSYPIDKCGFGFSPNLPIYYSKTFSYNGNIYYKPTLTYFIDILHKHASEEIFSIVLICMPNGVLYPFYRKKILQAGKTTKGVRYAYKEEPRFLLLSEEKEYKFRVEFLVKSKKFSQRELIGIDENKYRIPVWIEV